MAAAADPNPSPPKTSLFLGCFGLSGKRTKKPVKVSGEHHHKRGWFRRSTFLLKQSTAGAKTVPVDSDQINLKKNSSMFIKSKLKKKSASLHIPIKPQVPAPVKASQEQIPLKKRPSLEKKVIVEKQKARKDDNQPRTPTNESFRRRIEAIRNSASQPKSLDESNRIIMPRTISFPARVNAKKPPKEVPTNKVDPMIGMSIIMVTLVILITWGRLCAILCTCTWLYFVPRLRTKPDQTDGSVFCKPVPEEYMKKRVVFEGFLERNHNRSFL